MFKMRNGIVEEVQVGFGDYIGDIAVELPEPRQRQPPNPPFHPEGYM